MNALADTQLLRRFEAEQNGVFSKGDLQTIFGEPHPAAFAGALPDLGVLNQRLNEVQSRLPRLKRICSMSPKQLAAALTETATKLADTDLEHELAGLLQPEELTGLAIRIRTSVAPITTFLLCKMGGTAD